MGMIYISSFLQGLEPAPVALVIMLLVPFSVYNMNRKTDEEEDSVNHPGRYLFTKRYEQPLAHCALVAYVLAAVIAASFGWGAVIVTLVPLIAGIFYSMPVLPKAFGYRRLKEIPIMKNLVVGSSWSIILVLLPCMIASVPITLQTCLCLLFFFTYAFIASSLPDMRDREGDALAGVITIPVMVGVERTKKVLGALNWITACVVIILGVSTMIPTIALLLYAGAHCYTQYCITSFGMAGGNDFLCDILSDGQFLIIGSIVFLLQTVIPYLV